MANVSAPATSSRKVVAALTGIVVGSWLIRTALAHRHSVPRLFPDEYIYTALSRAIGHGHYAIRGETVHFPGVVEPLLAAPIWAAFGATTAYHVVQSQNALAASLAAIPIYVLARRLELSFGYSLAAAVYGLLLPSLVLVAYTSSDMVAYVFAIAAIAAAVSAIDEPTGRNQLMFFAFATLATLTRVQYFVLVPAYLIAVLAVDRRAAWRRHRIALLATIPVGLAVAVALIGFYESELSTPMNVNYVKWFSYQAFLLAIDAGVLIVPGAVAAVLRPTTRRELGFSVLAGATTLMLLGEATAHAANSSQFKERYLFVILVLLGVAFGLYAKHGAGRRVIVIPVAIAIFVAVARLPLSQFATAIFKTDSNFLSAVSYLQDRLGTGTSSLFIAVVAGAAAIGAVALSYSRRAALGIVFACATALGATGLALHADINASNHVRSQSPRDLTWVDDNVKHGVTAIETTQAQKEDLLSELFWNSSIEHEVVLGTAMPTDTFTAPHLVIGPDGSLRQIKGDILFHDYGTTALFTDARRIASAAHFTLWDPRRDARFRLVLDGRYWDGWVSRRGRLRAWPRTAGNGVKVSFVLSLPADWPRAATISLGRASFRVRPGQRVQVSCVSGQGMLDLPVKATGTVIDKSFRDLGPRLTHIVVADRPAQSQQLPLCAKT